LRTNYVLIDFESVQPEQLAALDQDHFKVMLFVGAHQAKLPYEIAAAIQRLGAKVKYIKISGNGPNALDFHIAFYIGEIASADPTAYFHIISKDKGFDPLIQHLKARKILAARAKDISEIPLVKAANSKSPEQRLEIVVAKLRQLKASKPRTVKTLKSTIASLFQKQLSDGEVTAVLDALHSSGMVAITDEKVTYALPTDGARAHPRVGF
jgi:septum formation topological specificity factor MinE